MNPKRLILLDKRNKKKSCYIILPSNFKYPACKSVVNTLKAQVLEIGKSELNFQNYNFISV